MKKNKFSIQIMAEISIIAALGYVLDLIASAYSSVLPFANGGSVGIAMVCVILISFRRGPLAGFVTGLIMGLLDLLDGFYSISDKFYKVALQLCLDYILAYASCFVAGFYKPLYQNAKKKQTKITFLILGAVSAGLAKYLMHFISGVLYWPEFEGQSTLPRILYSLTYNGGYMIPCTILSTIVFVLVASLQPILINAEYKKKEVIKEEKTDEISKNEN